MPLYLDIHDLHGPVHPEDLAKAHAADVEVQQKYGVNYLKYWVNESRGKVFCLVEAPNPEAANHVHRDAHGLTAEKIIEVDPEIADGFLGGGEVNSAGAVLMPGSSAAVRDPAIRTIVFTDIVDSTALTQSIGDEAAMEMLNLHNRVVRNALADSGGREVKHTGDGIMASFVSAAAAVKCAAQVPVSRSKSTTIFLAAPSSSRPGCAHAPSPNKSSSRMPLSSSVLARSSGSKMPANFH